MASKRKRTKAHRRDRRKAKASRWKRQGKTAMNAKVGHGPSGSSGGPGRVRCGFAALRMPPPKPQPPNRYRLLEPLLATLAL